MTERTPGEWRVDRGFEVVTADDHLIATAYAGVSPDTAYGISELETCRANAEHIVRCVNAHDALVEAARDVLGDEAVLKLRHTRVAALHAALDLAGRSAQPTQA